MVKQIVEFAAAFATFRRTSTNDDGAPITVDTRDEGARAWANMLLTNPQSLSLIKASDCAAIFSACVGVMYPASALQLRGMKGRNLEVTLQRLQQTDRLPLATIPGHPAAQFLAMLLTTRGGRRLYIKVALLLLEAQSDSDLCEFLYYPPGCTRGRTPIEDPVDGTDGESDEADGSLVMEDA